MVDRSGIEPLSSDFQSATHPSMSPVHKSVAYTTTNLGELVLQSYFMAASVGFEPTVRCRITGFQDQLLKPLGHLAIYI